MSPQADGDGVPTEENLGASSSEGGAPVVSATDAMLLEARLNALLACDANILSYDPSSFVMVLSRRGRNMRMIAAPLFVVASWGVLWAGLFTLDGMEGARDDLSGLEDLVSPLLVPISFLLVFRLGRAAVRFWDARTAVGKLVEVCRSIVSTAAVGCSAGDASCFEIAEKMGCWVCVLPIVVKNFLRPAKRQLQEESSLTRKRRFEIGPLLSDLEAEEVLNSARGSYAPIMVLDKLRQLAWEASVAVGNDCEDGSNKGGRNSGGFVPAMMLYRQLNEQIDILTGAWGATERINATPLPFVYVVHLRTFLMLYLALWFPIEAAIHGWIALPILFAISWALLGTEAAAVECERPFGHKSNHLALGKACVTVSKNVAQTLRNVQDKNNAVAVSSDLGNHKDGFEDEPHAVVRNLG